MADSVKLLQPPQYTDDERQALVDFVFSLRKTYIQDFLGEAELQRSGTKDELRDRLQDALDEEAITYEALVAFLDTVAPWGKQHVILYTGPRGDLQSWKDPESVLQHLRDHRVGKFFNARLPLILPDKLTLSSITHSEGVFRIAAVQKRDYTERMSDHDEHKETEDGTLITLRAYANHLSRTLVSFEWDLQSNMAMLQITQLPKDTLYEEVVREFFELVRGWLDMERFAPVDIRKAIKKLHELEEAHQTEARSHAIDYRTLQGRRLSARSASPRDSVLGELVIDDAMNTIRKKGVGHLGNFYWLPEVQPGPAPNPVSKEVHIVLIGDKRRINFRTPNSEEVVRYVLHRVRTLS